MGGRSTKIMRCVHAGQVPMQPKLLAKQMESIQDRTKPSAGTEQRLLMVAVEIVIIWGGLGGGRTCLSPV